MKRITAILLLCVFLFGGCSDMPADMFAIPEMPQMQKELIDTVGTVLSSGYEYSAPRSGINRQPLQLIDIDGDGEEEGIALLRDALDTYKTFIYVFEKGENGFKLFDIIEGSEKELLTISYSDVLGKNGYEIIAEWVNDGEDGHPITVYNLIADSTEKVLDISAIQYSVSDIDGDGMNDFLAVVKRGEELYADVYTAAEGELERQAQIPLAKDGGKILRIKTGGVTDGRNGVFIEREMGSGIITDLISYDGDGFVNLLPDGDVSMTGAMCDDVNGDGVIEIPKEIEEYIADSTANRCYRWNTVSEEGDLMPSAFTYHSFIENWYLLMPLSWSESVYAERTVIRSGQIEVHFSTRELMDADEGVYIEAPLFTVYVLTGDSRYQYAQESGDFIISEREDTIFAAKLISDSYLGTQINESFIKSIFKNRESEWISEILFA